MVCGHEQMADHNGHGIVTWYALERSYSLYRSRYRIGKWSIGNIIRLETIMSLEPYCSEFLVHAADNEGLQKGIDEELVQKLAQWCSIPVTYAGGSRSFDDLHRVETLSDGKVHLTIGSALDIFGGGGVKFEDCVEWNRSRK